MPFTKLHWVVHQDSWLLNRSIEKLPMALSALCQGTWRLWIEFAGA